MICRGKACLARMNALIINDNGHDFRVVPVFDRFSPNVSHWAKNTHHRHTAGFYYGVPWRAATRINVFCRDEACFVQFPRAIYSYKRKRKYIIL